MNENQSSNLDKAGEQVRRRFILRVGVLGWGVPVALAWAFWTAASEGWDQLPILLPLALVIFPLGGIAFGGFMWWLTERMHSRRRAASELSASDLRVHV